MKKNSDTRKRRLPTPPNGRSPGRPKKHADGAPLRLSMGFWDRRDMTEGSKNRLAAAEALAGKSAIGTAGNLRDFGANESQNRFDNARNLGIGTPKTPATKAPVQAPVATNLPPMASGPGYRQTAFERSLLATANQPPVAKTPVQAPVATNLPPMASGPGYQQAAFERSLLATANQPLRELDNIRKWRESSIRGFADGRKTQTVVDGVHQPGAVIGPGTGTSDEVGPARLPESGEEALLSHGETVVPAEATKKINAYVFNDPQGLEKATLANIDDPVNPRAFNKRIQAVGGVEAVAPFKLGEPEETAMNRTKAPLRAASKLPKGFRNGKPLMLQEGGIIKAADDLETADDRIQKAIDAAEGRGGQPAQQGDTGQVADTSTREADATGIDPDAVVTDNRLKQTGMTPEMKAFYEKQAADQAAQAAAVKAYEEEQRLKAAQKDSGGIFGFADGKPSPLRAMEGRPKQTKKPARYANGIPGVTAATMPEDWAPKGRVAQAAENVLDKAKRFAKYQPVSGGKFARLAVRTGAAGIGVAGAAKAAEIYGTDTEDYADRLNRITGGDYKAGDSFGSDLLIRGAGAVAQTLGMGEAPSHRRKATQQAPTQNTEPTIEMGKDGVPRFTAVGDPNDSSASDAVTDNLSARFRQDAVAQQRLADSKLALGSNDADVAQQLADNKSKSFAVMNPTGYGLGDMGVDSGSGRGGAGGAKLLNTILESQRLRHTVNQDATAREVEDSKRLEEILGGVENENERNSLRALRASAGPELFYGVPAEQQFERLKALKQVKEQLHLPKGASGAIDMRLLNAIMQANNSGRDDSLENPVTQYFQQNVPLSDVIGSRMPWNPAVAPVLDASGKRRGSLSGRLSPETQALIQSMIAK